MTDEEILFLWHERVKDGRIRVWMEDGVLHFRCHEAETHEHTLPVPGEVA